MSGVSLVVVCLTFPSLFNLSTILNHSDVDLTYSNVFGSYSNLFYYILTHFDVVFCVYHVVICDFFSYSFFIRYSSLIIR